MSVNFFDPQCQEMTIEIKFGLCDDKPHHSAYIDTSDSDKWIAIIENNGKVEVIFTAIDNCIDIRRPDGSKESRCDGMITYTDKIIFIELKERQSKGWIEKGESQLRTTISIFSSNNNIDQYELKAAYIANKFRPIFESNAMTRMQKFKDDTGFILKIRNMIEL
jgi:hypothetical protein